MLVFVGLVAGFAASSSLTLTQTLLTWGAVICWVLAFAIWRAHRRHDLMRKVLSRYHANSGPTSLGTEELRKRRRRLRRPLNVGSMRGWVGYALPLIVAVSMTAAEIWSWTDYFPIDEQPVSQPCQCECGSHLRVDTPGRPSMRLYHCPRNNVFLLIVESDLTASRDS